MRQAQTISEVSEAPTGGSGEHERTGRRARVLVLRSCRPAQFAAAVAVARQRHPQAEIVALSHAGHRAALLAAGVDEVIELPGRRFGLLRISPGTLLRLRRERFEEIVIPQMTAHVAAYGNLYRLAATIAASSVTVIPGDYEPVTLARSAFRRHAIRKLWYEVISWFDAPALLAALAVAYCWPRRRQQPGARTRVLHIITSLGVGGAQRQLMELVNRTPADRYDVEILVLGRDDGGFSRQWLTRRDVHVAYVPEWPRLVASALEIRRHCLQGRYDIVHTWLFLANVMGVAGARLAGVPCVIASVRNLSLWKRTWCRQWWFRAADVLSSHAADVVTVNAQVLTRDHGAWTWYPSRRIHVIHNGLDPSRFLVDVSDARRIVRRTAWLTDETIVIGTVGRLAPEKDHLTFLRTIRAVREARPGVHGIIVGDGALRAQLEAAAAEMGLGAGVTFLGERSDARRLMAGFDVFLLTSAIEGFPNVLLEAAFLGVPSVASRVGGNPDILPDPHDTFDAGDHAAAARRVLALLDAPALAAAGADAVRQRALELFTADRMVRRWFTLYDRSSRPAKAGHYVHIEETVP